MKKSIVRLTFSERFSVAQVLQKYCKQTPEGLAKYDEGYDDARVAAIIGGKINELHIRGVRREIIGQLHKNSSTSNLSERINEIEDYLTSKYPDWRDQIKDQSN